MEDAEVGSSSGLENRSNQRWLIVRCYHLPPIKKLLYDLSKLRYNMCIVRALCGSIA